MIWLLLNQHFVNLDNIDCVNFALEEAVSSELQLVQVLVSALVLPKIGILRVHSQTSYNLPNKVEEQCL